MHIQTIFILIVVFFFACPIADAQVASVESNSIKTIESSFKSREGFVFDARLVVPSKPNRNGYGVLMIGGGYGNDLNWSVPGFFNDRGTKKQITILGKSHADAPLIAKSLAEKGFVVMYWSTFRRADSKLQDQASKSNAPSIANLLRFAKDALASFRAQKLFPDKNVILLGHSLGGVRAANIAATDGNVNSLVLLASAQLTRTSSTDRGRNENKTSAIEWIHSIDTNADRACSQKEYDTWAQKPANKNHPLANHSFKQLDYYPDGRLVDWEISAGFARQIRSQADFKKKSRKVDPSGLRWTEDILAAHKIDTLIVYGSLDSHQSHHAPIMADLIKNKKLTHVEQKVLPNVGHQLGPEDKNRIGPISRASLDVVAGWLAKRISKIDDLP